MIGEDVVTSESVAWKRVLGKPLAAPYRSEPAPVADKVPSAQPFWIVNAVLIALVLLGFFTHQGAVLNLIFTPIAAAAGLYLFLIAKDRYLTYTVELWVLTPLVRRLADGASSYHGESLVLLAPIAVSLISVIGIWKMRKDWWQLRTLPFALALMGVCYGLIVGLAMNPATGVATTALRWITPLLLGLYCCLVPAESGRKQLEFQNSMIVLGTISAAYGVVQYVFAPSWDCLWLRNVLIGAIAPSFGAAVPFGIRVFGTMHSPGIFSSMMMACMLLIFVRRPLVIAIGAPVLAAGLLLSLVRVSYVGLILGSIYILFTVNAKGRSRLIATAAGLAVIGGLAIGASNATSGIATRLFSFTDLKHDDSARSRSAGVRDASREISHNPLGRGLGYLDSDAYMRTPMAVTDEVSPHDIGLLEIAIELGVPGAATYMLGVLLLAFLALRDRDKWPVTVSAPLIAIFIAFFPYFPTTNPFIYFDGLLIWIPAALLLRPSPEVASSFRSTAPPWNTVGAIASR